MANLRVVADNWADFGTIGGTAGVGNLGLANLRKDAKSLVWRASGTSATITLSLSNAQTIRCVALAFTNLTANATMSVSGPGAGIGSTLCVPAAYEKPYDWGDAPNGANTFGFGGGNLARVYFAGGSASNISISISDSGNPDGYIEASRLIVGDYWEPQYNADYGASASVVDSTVNSRSDAGDLISDRGYRHRTLNLALNTLNTADRAILFRILRANGLSRPIFASLYPQSTDTLLERDHQIYGKLSELSQIAMQFVNMFSGTLALEEV